MKLKQILSLILIACVITACTVPQSTVQADGSTNTVYAVDPKFEQITGFVRAANTISSPVNPYAGIIDWVLGVALAGTALYAKFQTDRKAKAQLLAKTIVQGVENAGSTETKKAIQLQATAVGVEGALGTFVQQVNTGQV
jgi:hypothetical protein